MQKAVRATARATGIPKPVSCHTFRHSFATPLPEQGQDIRTVGCREIKHAGVGGARVRAEVA